jgi:hypothetical protein
VNDGLPPSTPKSCRERERTQVTREYDHEIGESARSVPSDGAYHQPRVAYQSSVISQEVGFGV